MPGSRYILLKSAGLLEHAVPYVFQLPLRPESLRKDQKISKPDVPTVIQIQQGVKALISCRRTESTCEYDEVCEADEPIVVEVRLPTRDELGDLAAQRYDRGLGTNLDGIDLQGCSQQCRFEAHTRFPWEFVKDGERDLCDAARIS